MPCYTQPTKEPGVTELRHGGRTFWGQTCNYKNFRIPGNYGACPQKVRPPSLNSVRSVEGRMKRLMGCTAVIVLIGLVFSLWTCTPVLAQSTAQISGVVKDQSGAVLPGVEVTATHTD